MARKRSSNRCKESCASCGAGEKWLWYNERTRPTRRAECGAMYSRMFGNSREVTPGTSYHISRGTSIKSMPYAFVRPNLKLCCRITREKYICVSSHVLTRGRGRCGYGGGVGLRAHTSGVGRPRARGKSSITPRNDVFLGTRDGYYNSTCREKIDGVE